MMSGCTTKERAMVDGIDREYFFSKRPGKTYISKTFGRGELMRYHDRVLDNDSAPVFAKVDNEIVLRVTHSGRIQVKATVFETDRKIKTLLIQKYTARGPSEHYHFTFLGKELNALLDFLANIPRVPLETGAKIHLTDDDLRQIKFTYQQAHSIISKNPELFLELARSEHLQKDLVAVGYRRKQLERFEAMVDDENTDEAAWQCFFEANTWIFGYGLSYQFLTGLDDEKLEQIVTGYDLSGPGKRTDALMKTRGRINSLCFVEIKRANTPLLAPKEYRSGAWAPSDDLAGGVAQVQATVQGAMQRLTRKLDKTDEFGDPTGEELFSFEPRSCLVIGNLGRFRAHHGINEAKFRSFELYHRNTWRPEIITFDELLERARFIVEHADADTAGLDDDISF